MSGFSPAWLALREPADRAARNAEVLDICARTFAGRPSLAICDLGAGTGASMRALAPLLPTRQHWTLMDHDAANLAAVHGADARSGMTWRTVVTDFAARPACWPAGTDLVTASALLDLTSADWIARFVAALARDRIALLAMLTFDGVIAIDPHHPRDAAVAAAFAVHQTRDKGFGPAAGPEASNVLMRCLSEAGYRLTAGDSPWRIDRDAAALMSETLTGIATAVGETGLVADVDDWLRDRLAATRRLTIGHRDVFARPAD
ncbi:MAG: class I SAM-dependent methyltransferase [Rhodospirillaceae bacterium]|nr:class I SAM-dependent methyltransferase [Rhodospirillaceae bacterium]